MANENFDKAKREKNDEFYTQLPDIENELKNYKEYFAGKVIFCNCDDPEKSNFWKYFYNDFHLLGLKKLISTHYKPSRLFDFNTQAYKLEYDGKKTKRTDLNGDGDFRSQECVDILKQSDIVCTNPPFSLFKEYVAQLMGYKKKFIILGNKNAITYKEVFQLIKDNKLWVGATSMSKDILFNVPEHFAKKLIANKKESSGYKIIDGEVKARAQAIWFANLDHKKRHEYLPLGKAYNKKDYPKYENYDAINIDKTTDIPADYDGAMGVPISFLDKYNPDQFEIIALGITGSINFTKNKKMEILDKTTGKPTGKFTINAKGTLYKLYNPDTDKPPAFKDIETGDLYSSIYARIIIKKRK